MSQSNQYPSAACFDRDRLLLRPLAERHHDLSLAAFKPLAPEREVPAGLREVAHRVVAAKQQGAAVVLLMGAHVLRAGVQRFLIDLLQDGYISCLAMNGAGIIHDFELALIGKTTESVARYIAEGQFGLWQETGRINDIVRKAAQQELGLGEAMGREIEQSTMPFKDASVVAAAHRFGVPVTVHVGIGYDIVHQHPNCDGAAWGAASYRDFLRFAGVLEKLDGGVVMNFGSAVMGPEVFLKALAMVRNVARQEGKTVASFTSLVCDLKKLPEDTGCEAARNNPDYYFRPWKTMLVRSLSGTGRSYYVQGDHARTIPALWTAIQHGKDKLE